MNRLIKVMAVFACIVLSSACSEMPTLDCMSKKDVSDMKEC